MTAWPLPRIEQWFLRAGLFLLPLVFWWDTYDKYVLPKLLVARVLVLGLLILYVARAMSARTLVVKRTRLDLPWLAFVASAGLSTLFAENQNAAVFGIYSRYDGLLTILTYAAMFWLSVQALEGPRDARALLRVLLVSGYLVAVLAIIQSVTDSLAQNAQAPAFGTLGQKNVLGAFLALLCPLARVRPGSNLRPQRAHHALHVFQYSCGDIDDAGSDHDPSARPRQSVGQSVHPGPVHSAARDGLRSAPR